MEISYSVNILGTISEKLTSLGGFVAMAKELVQNADDENSPFISFTFSEDGLYVRNASKFKEEDFKRIENIAARGKEEDSSKTGAFGIGFVSVYQICDHPELQSSGIKYTFYPENAKIMKDISDIADYTEFHFPWAKDPISQVRQGLHLPAITEDDIQKAEKDLIESAPNIMLFLRHLRKINVFHKDSLVAEFLRTDENPPFRQIINSKSPNSISQWIVYTDNPREHIIGQLKKKSVAEIAFPLSPNEIEADGILYDFLPTGLYTGYKFHINGDFFPTSDRRNILVVGDPEKVIWNNKVIDNISNLFVNCISDLKERVQPLELYSYLPEKGYFNKNLPVLSRIKDKLYESIIIQPIVPNELKKWYKPGEIYLLDSENDELRQTLNDIGIPLVSKDLRKNCWSLLYNDIGVKRLDLNNLIQFIKNTNVPNGVLISDAPEPFNSFSGITNILSYLQERLKYPGEEKFLFEFSHLPICPSQTGYLQPFFQLKLLTASVRKVIPGLSQSIFVNFEFQSSINDILKELVDDFNWPDVVDYLSQKKADEIETMVLEDKLDMGELYDYLADHESEILKESAYVAKIQKSQIFITNKQFKSLTGLFFSGNYEDPLGLDIIISEEYVSDKAKGFLKKLGIKQLDFKSYVKTYVTEYYSNKSMWEDDDKRLALAEEIRKNFSLFSDDTALRELLSETRFIPCNDGEFHSPKEIYLKSDILDTVLENDYLYPNEKIIGNKYPHWIEWLTQLSVNEEPKPVHIVDRIRKLQVKWSVNNIKKIEKLFYFLCDVFKKEGFHGEKDFEVLRTLAWIPSENEDGHYYLPNKISLPNFRILFNSQSIFAPFNQQQKIHTNFINFLEIGYYPKPILVLKHLKYLSEEVSQDQIKPNEITYIYRDLNARNNSVTDPELETLTTTKPIFIENIGFQDVDNCFWYSHPFGSYRFSLPEEYNNYFNILKRLGVRNEPGLTDYLNVLGDISTDLGNNSIDDSTREIVNHIYWYLVEHLDEIEKDQLEELSNKKIILDRRGLLRKPKVLFFEDKGFFVDIFKDKLKNELVSIESNTWQLFSKLGVRYLSKAIHPSNFRFSNQQTHNQTDLNLIKERNEAITTIVETQKKDFDEGWDTDFLNYLQILNVPEIIVDYEIIFENGPLRSGNRSEDSFYDEDTHRLFLATSCTGPNRTIELARNLAYKLNPQIDPCHVLPVLMEILNPNKDVITITQYLQKVGYDIVLRKKYEPEAQDTKTKNESEFKENKDTTLPKEPDSSKDIDEQDTQAENTTEDTYEDKASQLLRQLGENNKKTQSQKDITADEIHQKRKEWLQQRLEFEKSSRVTKSSEFESITHPLTPEEQEQHKKMALVFYNRQIQDLTSRVVDLQEGNIPPNYPDSIYSPEWNDISKSIRERDGSKCRRCGLTEADGVTLVVHHIVPRKDGGSNWPSNLITLCRICHAEVEGNSWLL